MSDDVKLTDDEQGELDDLCQDFRIRMGHLMLRAKIQGASEAIDEMIGRVKK